MKAPYAYFLAAVGAGLLCGWAAWASREVQPAVFFVFGSSAALGFAWPKGFPIGATLAGIGIPLFYLAAAGLGHPSAFPPEPNVWATLVALIPAWIGAGLGAGFRVMATFAAGPR